MIYSICGIWNTMWVTDLLKTNIALIEITNAVQYDAAIRIYEKTVMSFSLMNIP